MGTWICSYPVSPKVIWCFQSVTVALDDVSLGGDLIIADWHLVPGCGAECNALC